MAVGQVRNPQVPRSQTSEQCSASGLGATLDATPQPWQSQVSDPNGARVAGDPRVFPCRLQSNGHFNHSRRRNSLTANDFPGIDSSNLCARTEQEEGRCIRSASFEMEDSADFWSFRPVGRFAPAYNRSLTGLARIRVLSGDASGIAVRRGQSTECQGMDEVATSVSAFRASRNEITHSHHGHKQRRQPIQQTLPRGPAVVRAGYMPENMGLPTQQAARPNMVKVLFLAANPQRSSPLQLDNEAREIGNKIRASKYRDDLELVTRWAIRPDDLQQSLLEIEPHVLHFSGHGTEDEAIVLVGEHENAAPVTKEALRHLLSVLKDNLRLVVLNACYSRPQAEAIVECIDCAIGMNSAITDRAALLFAGSFYRALGFGRNVSQAFELARSTLKLEGIPNDATPELLVRSGVDPTRVFLLTVGGPVSAATRSESTKPSATVEFNFDVFLCYNSEDKKAVKCIGEQLKKRGLKPWLDEWELPPGRPWQQLIEEQIESIGSAAVFVGKAGIGPWQNIELQAFLREFVRRGAPVIPILLEGATDRPKLPPFLSNMGWVNFGRDDPDPLGQLIWGITGDKPPDP